MCSRPWRSPHRHRRQEYLPREFPPLAGKDAVQSSLADVTVHQTGTYYKMECRLSAAQMRENNNRHEIGLGRTARQVDQRLVRHASLEPIGDQVLHSLAIKLQQLAPRLFS